MIEPNRAEARDSLPAQPVGFTLHPVGLVRRTTAPRMSRMPRYFRPRRRAALELFHPFQAGLLGLCPGTEIWVLTLRTPSMRAHPVPQVWSGVFASLSEDRPNPVEFSRALLLEVDLERGALLVAGLESRDGTPILDIRPGTPAQGLLTLATP